MTKDHNPLPDRLRLSAGDTCECDDCNDKREAAAELERLTECRRADAEHLALEVSEREARGREIERLRAALTTIAAYRGRVAVAHHLAGIAEGALEYESEPPAQYPDPSPIDVEPA
jgi:hypothetical protein